MGLSVTNITELRCVFVHDEKQHIKIINVLLSSFSNSYSPGTAEAAFGTGALCCIGGGWNAA